MVVNPFLIFYYPGARGDFLASVLTDTLSNNSSTMVTTPGMLNYKKAHYLDKFSMLQPYCSLSDITNQLSIRIRPVSFNDVLTISYYCLTKIAVEDRPITSIIDDVIRHEKIILQHNIDPIFKHVVDFPKLFDMTFLSKFYNRLTNSNIPSHIYDYAKQNININPIITLNNYREYLDISESDLERLKIQYG